MAKVYSSFADKIQKILQAGLLVPMLLLGAIPTVMACGWFGDGEDGGPEALAIGPDGKPLEKEVDTPASLTRQASHLLTFGASGYSGAFRLFLKAAKSGYPPAQNNLAEMLNKGLGVVPDQQQAAYWYLQAAHCGEAHAQHSIGRYYLDGIGVKKDPTEGLAWILRSAMQGHKTAAADLVQLYRDGTGTAKDPMKARIWAQVVIDQGVQLPVVELTSINTLLSDQQQQEAVKQAAALRQSILLRKIQASQECSIRPVEATQ